MINMKLDAYTCPLTNRKYFSLLVTDFKSKRAEVLVVDKEATTEELVVGLRKLIDRLEFPRD